MVASPFPETSKGHWLDGKAVLELFEACDDPDLALAALDQALSTGGALAKPTIVNHPRPGGKMEPAGTITALSTADWGRAKTRKSVRTVLLARKLNLPATGHQRAAFIEGVRFEAGKVRELAAEHGAAQSAKNPGGATSRAHGAVAARLTLELLKQRSADPGRFDVSTGVSLVPRVEQLYQEEQPNRGKPCPKNAERLANGVLSVLRPMPRDVQLG